MLDKEIAVRHLPKHEAEKLRQDVTVMLKTSQTLEPNLKREDVQALKEDILTNKTYKQIECDPTSFLGKTTKKQK